MRFLCLQSKDVINACNGKKIGFISDIDIDHVCYCIQGIFVEKNNCLKMLYIFKGPPLIYIPKENIISIGEDVIIVNMTEN